MEIKVGLAILLTTLAGLSTSIGSAIAFFMRTPNFSYLSVTLGFSAGVMIYISFTDLLGTAIQHVGFLTANIAFFIGILIIAVVDMIVPHEYEEERETGIHSDSTEIEQQNNSDSNSISFRPRRRRLGYGTAQFAPPSKSVLKRSGVLLALGIAIHNLPEGMATFSTVASGHINLGIMVAIAIGLHNIPEGIAVSIPIAYATGSRRQGFIYSFLSGIAEPVGALIAYVILLPFLTPTLLLSLLAFAAGVMIYVSLDEILPLAHQYGKGHLVLIGLVSGMLIMAFSLLLLR
jgi:ZIP family zinc transporter